jgi:hypothetical protein
MRAGCEEGEGCVEGEEDGGEYEGAVSGGE